MAIRAATQAHQAKYQARHHSSADAAPQTTRRAVTPPMAIVPVTHNPRHEEPRLVRTRSAAPFIAHLAATSLGLPQTRERRRASETECQQHYRSANALGTAQDIGQIRQKRL